METTASSRDRRVWLVPVYVVIIRIPNSCDPQAREGRKIILRAETKDGFYGWPFEEGMGPAPKWSGRHDQPAIVWWTKAAWRRVK